MLSSALLIFHIILVAIMIGLILLQKSEGGGLGIGGGNFMTARGAANLLTRSTAVVATLFFISTLVLALNFKGVQKQKSIIDDEAGQPTVESSAPDTPVVPVGATTEQTPSVPDVPAPTKNTK